MTFRAGRGSDPDFSLERNVGHIELEKLIQPWADIHDQESNGLGDRVDHRIVEHMIQ